MGKIRRRVVIGAVMLALGGCHHSYTPDTVPTRAIEEAPSGDGDDSSSSGGDEASSGGDEASSGGDEGSNGGDDMTTGGDQTTGDDDLGPQDDTCRAARACSAGCDRDAYTCADACGDEGDSCVDGCTSAQTECNEQCKPADGRDCSWGRVSRTTAGAGADARSCIAACGDSATVCAKQCGGATSPSTCYVSCRNADAACGTGCKVKENWSKAEIQACYGGCEQMAAAYLTVCPAGTACYDNRGGLAAC